MKWSSSTIEDSSISYSLASGAFCKGNPVGRTISETNGCRELGELGFQKLLVQKTANKANKYVVMCVSGTNRSCTAGLDLLYTSHAFKNLSISN